MNRYVYPELELNFIPRGCPTRGTTMAEAMLVVFR
jgi:hypothetical protein